MSLLLHIIGKVIAYAVLAVIVLRLLAWLSKNKSDQIARPSSGEWPEDKATHGNRISARPYSSSRQDLKDEQERRRA
jgi:hypothetical protein